MFGFRCIIYHSLRIFERKQQPRPLRYFRSLCFRKNEPPHTRRQMINKLSYMMLFFLVFYLWFRARLFFCGGFLANEKKKVLSEIFTSLLAVAPPWLSDGTSTSHGVEKEMIINISKHHYLHTDLTPIRTFKPTKSSFDWWLRALLLLFVTFL